jgi:HEAT repeats
MSKAFATIAATLTTAAALAAVVAAQQPHIGNGRITTQAATALQQTFNAAVGAQADVAWIGYAVPVVDGERTMCCFSSGTTWIDGNRVTSDGSACCGMCGLEPSVGGGNTSMSNRSQVPPAGPIKLEGADQVVVLFRVVARQVERVRVFSEDCQLDAGGREVVWLTGVRPADSVALLEGIVKAQADRRDRIIDGAITAIAMHEDASADATLERLLATSQPTFIREKVPFWLGNARGRRGLQVLQRTIKDDPSTDVKKKAVFGISQSREPNAVDILIDNARTNGDTAVRSEAIFWLGQKAGSKAAGAITERIEQDPDTEVKKRAVFALSQLPKSEGVPLLIQVARTNPNPAVKKQAIFWLGQSKDPRALDYFAEILK